MGGESRGLMKALAWFLFAGVLLMGLVQAGHAQEVKPIKLTFALFQPATAELSKVNTEYAKEIERRTNGRVQIQVFQSGSLLGAPAMYQGIRNGIADMGNSLTSYSAGNFPFTSITELPVDAQTSWTVSYAMDDFLLKYQPKEWNDVHVLTAYGPNYGLMVVGTSKAQVKTQADLKGKSFRSVFADLTTSLGATVKDVPMAEVFDAVSKGVIDGVYVSAEPLKSWRLADVCKYLTVDLGLPQPAIVCYNAMNKAKWNSLPPDIQKIITEVSREYVGKLGATWDEQAVAGMEYVKSLGSTVYMLPKEESAKWKAAQATIIDQRLKSLTAKGFTQKEVEEAWNYFKSRVSYWNGQQAKHNITPMTARMERLLK